VLGPGFLSHRGGLASGFGPRHIELLLLLPGLPACRGCKSCCYWQTTVLIVDAMNVIGSRPDGWWRDRQGALQKLVARLVALDGSLGEITVVMDGREQREPPPGEAGNGVCVAYAGHSRADAADDHIVALLEQEAPPSPAHCMVITSDRRLRERCAASGAEVAGAGWLLRQLDGDADS